MQAFDSYPFPESGKIPVAVYTYASGGKRIRREPWFFHAWALGRSAVRAQQRPDTIPFSVGTEPLTSKT